LPPYSTSKRKSGFKKRTAIWLVAFGQTERDVNTKVIFSAKKAF